MEKILEYIQSHRQNYLKELFRLLQIPSISPDPTYSKEMGSCCEFLANHLKKLGMHHVQILPTEGHSVVYAEWLVGSDVPTILIYGHYDVQPAEPLNEWETPPFEPEIREKEIYARGAADNKGPLFVHVKAIEAYLKVTGTLPVNIKLLFEGEEEMGSKHLHSFVKQHTGLLQADAVIVSDTSTFAAGVPTISYGTRGLLGCQLNIRGAQRDLHSGDYGGSVANSIQILAEILAALKDRNGKIAIPGFYNDVLEMSPAEIRQLNTLPFDEDAQKHELGVSGFVGEKGFSVYERRWVRPTLELNGLLGGFTGTGMKTIIPAQAMAKITMRLVPKQDPDKIYESFKEYIRSLVPPEVTLEITADTKAKPYMIPFEHPLHDHISRALEHVFDRKPVFIRSGGTIGVLNTFSEVLQAPVALLGFAYPNNNAHAPNEHMSEEAFYKGIEVAAHLLNELKEWKNT